MNTLGSILLTLLIAIPLRASESAAPPIPLAEIGMRATAEYRGDALGVTATSDGAQLRTGFQKLCGTVTETGLALDSTEEGATGRLRLRASALGRDGGCAELVERGAVEAGEATVRWLRPGVVEEFSVSVDGLRQDFLIPTRPSGVGELALELALSGARAEAAGDGVKLTLTASGRALMYTRLHVADATGRTLAARLEVMSEARLVVRVDDAGAIFPVRIDPTFSDADWVVVNPGINGTNGGVNALATDGSGNLYLGGSFTLAGTAAANNIVKWNGTTWSRLGTGLSGSVLAIAVSGSNVYAGGSFLTAGGVSAQGVARWNGTAWSALGSSVAGQVYALLANGSDLFVGGFFTTAGGVSANRIAKWDGSAWSALGTGMNSVVSALALDAGGHLIAGGAFSTAGGNTARAVARWNGTTWSAVGTPLNFSVKALAVGGSAIYAGGEYTTIGNTTGYYVERWDGTTWTPLGTGMNNAVYTLVASGNDVYAGGLFSSAGGTPAQSVAKWNGSAWSALGDGAYPVVNALLFSGGSLYAGGGFGSAGTAMASNIARWDGLAWSALANGMDDAVRALAVSGSDLYIGGGFTTAGGVGANNVVKWNGSAWIPLGAGTDGQVNALAVSGSNLYVGGRFTMAGTTEAFCLARWDGASWWSIEGGSPSDMVNAIVVSGSDLYIGGIFTRVGFTNVSGLARWDGSSWSGLGNTVSNVNALAVMNGELYAAGDTVRKWNGSTWTSVGSVSLFPGAYTALAVSGNDLYLGGTFTTIGGVLANRIAKWNGTAWSALGSGVNGRVNAVAAGNGEVYVGGNFTTAGGASANRLARWNGSTWSAFGTGLNGQVRALALDSARHLFVGGDFGMAGTTVSPYLVRANLFVAPTVTDPASTAVTTTTATLRGIVTDDGGGTITERGVVFARTAVNPNPLVGGTGVTRVVAAGTTGFMGVDVSGLSAHTDYSFKAYATTAQGTGYTPVSSFTTGNNAPSAPGATIAATTGDAQTVPVSFPTTDADGDAVSITAAEAGTGLVVDEVTGSTVTFTPASGFVGDGSFSYTVSDGFGGTATGVITVAVKDNDAPTISVPANVTVHATSPAGAAASYLGAVAADNVAVTSLSYSQASGTLFPIGTTTVTVTARDAANNVAADTFQVTVTPPTAVEAWRYQHFATFAASGDAADSADPDRDGRVNLLELAFGTDPAGAASGPAPLAYAGTLAGSGTLIAPGTPRMLREGAGHAGALFVRRADYAATRLTYAVEFSANLTTWQTSAATPTVLATDGTHEVVSVPYPALGNGERAKYFRVRVTRTP